MADFSSSRPVELVKAGAFLHDRTNRPKVPRPGVSALARRHLPLLAGIAVALALVALAFQARDSWGTHRDWVVPVTAPLLAVGGVALGSLAVRREWNPLTPALFLVAGSVLVTAWDVWLDIADKDDRLRDGLAIANAVLLSLIVVASVAALAWVEVRRPTRAPAPGG